MQDVRTAGNENDRRLGPQRPHMQGNIDPAKATRHVYVRQQQIKATGFPKQRQRGLSVARLRYLESSLNQRFHHNQANEVFVLNEKDMSLRHLYLAYIFGSRISDYCAF